MDNKYRSCKELIEELVEELNNHVIDDMDKIWSKDMVWRGPGGIGTKDSLEIFQKEYQRPFLHAFPDKHAYEKVQLFDGNLAASTGYQEATHLGDWLGIPSTGKKVKVRYMDIWRAEKGKLVENWVMIDIIDFMEQIGIDFFDIIRKRAERGELFNITPQIKETYEVPIERHVIKTSAKDNSESQAKELVEAMVDALNDHVIDGMEQFWTKDMVWRGPAGIGTKNSLKAFQDEHQKPFLHAFSDKTAYDEVRLFDGDYAACTGYQAATHSGNWLGIPATGKKVRVRYMDIWRAEKGKLVENWVIIDIIDFMLQVGIDPLKIIIEEIENNTIKL